MLGKGEEASGSPWDFRRAQRGLQMFSTSGPSLGLKDTVAPGEGDSFLICLGALIVQEKQSWPSLSAFGSTAGRTIVGRTADWISSDQRCADVICLLEPWVMVRNWNWIPAAGWEAGRARPSLSGL